MDIDLVTQTTANLYWKDLNGAYLGCNQALATIIGLKSPKDIIGKTDVELYSDRLSEKNIEALVHLDKEVMTTGVERITQEIGFDETGKIVAYLTKKAPLRDKNNNIIGLMGTSIDISHLFGLQTAIINYSAGNLYWKDIHGRYLGCNKTFSDELGFASPEDIVGKTDYDLLLTDETLIKKILETDKEVIHTGKEIIREEIGATAGGEQRVFLSKKTPLRDENNKIIGVMGTSIDITQQKQAELIKMEFLNNIRHDIRTPLSGIMGFAGLIRDEAKSPKIKEYADNMYTSSQALMDLVNEILDTINITAGNTTLSKKKFDLKEKLLSIINLNKAKAEQKKLSLTLNFDKKVPIHLIGDPKRIHRIVLELVTNALKFTNKGHVTLSTELIKKSKRDVVIKISVTDTGIGFPESKKEEIFTHFRRLTPSYEGHYKGIGLGLTIVKQFVTDLDGEIYVDSKPAQGSTFSIILPLKESLMKTNFGVEETIEEQPKLHILQKPPAPSTKKLSKSKKIGAPEILVVEDQPIAAKLTEELLLSLDCNVDIAETGQSAILKAKAKRYDLIFMDIGLPDVDGIQAAREIRHWETPLKERTPIIALTAHMGIENKRDSVDAGIDAVLSKPLMKEMALDLLDGFVHNVPNKGKTFSATEAHAHEKISGKAIDLELGAKLTGKDPSFAKEMLVTFVTMLKKDKPLLKDYHQKKDWKGVYEIAHHIHGGACYCGTPRLKIAASNMQSYRGNKEEQREILYKELSKEIDAVEKAFKEL